MMRQKNGQLSIAIFALWHIHIQIPAILISDVL